MISEELGPEHLSAEDRICNLRSRSCLVWVTTEQTVRLIRLFTRPEERVEVLIIFFSRIVDHRNLWQALYELRGMEQSFASVRLGLPVVWRPNRCSVHYRLDCANPEHATTARTLVGFAQKIQGMQNWHNIMIGGKRLRTQLVEGSSMWSLLTTASFTPLLEFDFVGLDIFEALDMPQMAQADQTTRDSILKDFANRLSFERMRMMHPYWLEYLARKSSAPASRQAAPISGQGAAGPPPDHAGSATPAAGTRNAATPVNILARNSLTPSSAIGGKRGSMRDPAGNLQSPHGVDDDKAVSFAGLPEPSFHQNEPAEKELSPPTAEGQVPLPQIPGKPPGTEGLQVGALVSPPKLHRDFINGYPRDSVSLAIRRLNLSMANFMESLLKGVPPLPINMAHPQQPSTPRHQGFLPPIPQPMSPEERKSRLATSRFKALSFSAQTQGSQLQPTTGDDQRRFSSGIVSELINGPARQDGLSNAALNSENLTSSSGPLGQLGPDAARPGSRAGKSNQDFDISRTPTPGLGVPQFSNRYATIMGLGSASKPRSPQTPFHPIPSSELTPSLIASLVSGGVSGGWIVPSGPSRVQGWQVAWDSLMRRSVQQERKHIQDGKCPLRLLFDQMDKDKVGSVTIEELRKGMKLYAGTKLTNSQCMFLANFKGAIRPSALPKGPMNLEIIGDIPIAWKEFEVFARVIDDIT